MSSTLLAAPSIYEDHITNDHKAQVSDVNILAQDVIEQPESNNKTRTTEILSECEYSIFTANQKRFIVFIAAWAGFFSAVSATIYFPALNALARDLDVSDSLINLTITSYMITQGLVPSLIGNLSDTAGRRPAYIICFIVYIAANIGLALQTNYAKLFVFRCVQSAGSSATIAMANAVVADVAPPVQRGKYSGWTSGGILISAAIGPILGGILTEFLSWRAVFWFLVIFASFFFLLLGIFFPETARSKVGNGSVVPTGLNMSLVQYLTARKARRRMNDGSIMEPSKTTTPGKQPTPKSNRFNPFAAVKIVFEVEGAFVLLSNAFVFMAFYFVSATIPSQFRQKYGYNNLQIGLCYVPWGCGTLISSVVGGPLLDRNFRRHCKKAGVSIKKGRNQDLTDFPIERARLEIAFPALYAMCTFLLIFGWILQINGPVPALLVLLFLSALSTGAIFSTFNTLLIDIYPGQPATATAANNLVRCLLGAGATALVVPMIDAIGSGWAYTVLSVFLVATSPMSWILTTRGMGWRKKRAQAEMEKTRKLEQTSEEDMPNKG